MWSRLELNNEVVARPSARRLRPTRLLIEPGGIDRLDLMEGPGASWPSATVCGDRVALWLDVGTSQERLVFSGVVTSVTPRRDRWGWRFAIRCLGARWLVDDVTIRHPNSGVGRFRFNLPTDDPDHVPSWSGLTLGRILWQVLQAHAPALAERGVVLGPIEEFESLDLNPPTPVEIAGERLINALEQVLVRWAPNHRLVFEPIAGTSEAGTLRVKDRGRVVEPGSDEVGVIRLGSGGATLIEATERVEDCATRVRVVGSAEIEPFELRLSDESLQEDWTHAQEEAWTLADYESAREAADAGEVVSMSSRVVRVRSDDSERVWPLNVWAGTRRGRLRLSATPIDLPGQRLRSQQTRFVQSNQALTAGGTAEITVDRDFTINAFSRYALYALKGDEERPHVFRRYKPADPEIAARLQLMFAHNEPYRFNGGAGAVLTRTAMGFVEVGGIRYQGVVEIDPGAGTISFTEPVVAMAGLNQRDALLGDSQALNRPDDVVVFVPVAVEPIELNEPEDGEGPGYGGTAWSWRGLERTRTIALPEWRDRGAQSQVRRAASETHRALRDVRLRAVVTLWEDSGRAWLPLGGWARLEAYEGPGPDARTIDLGRWGQVALPVVAASLVWDRLGGATTTLVLSNDVIAEPGAVWSAATLPGLTGDAITNNPLDAPGLPRIGRPWSGWNGPFEVTRASSSSRVASSDPPRPAGSSPRSRPEPAEAANPQHELSDAMSGRAESAITTTTIAEEMVIPQHEEAHALIRSSGTVERVGTSSGRVGTPPRRSRASRRQRRPKVRPAEALDDRGGDRWDGPVGRANAEGAGPLHPERGDGVRRTRSRTPRGRTTSGGQDDPSQGEGKSRDDEG